jgi:hypothetical protein
MFAAWNGGDGDDRLFFSKLIGTFWSLREQIPNVASKVGPALATSKGKLYAAWKDAAGDLGLWYSSYDGLRWSPQTQIPGVLSSGGPALADFDGNLYVAWNDSTPDQRLWYAFFDGSRWSAQSLISDVAGSVSPTLAVFNGRLYAAWNRNCADKRLCYASFDGIKWSAPVPIPDAFSSMGLVLAAFDGKLFATWKGEDYERRLRYAFFDGTKWSAPHGLHGKSGQDRPKKTGLNMQCQEYSHCGFAAGINHFYGFTGTAPQCFMQTTILQTTNKWNVLCYSARTEIRSRLAATLGYPNAPTACYAFDSVNPRQCNKNRGAEHLVKSVSPTAAATVVNQLSVPVLVTVTTTPERILIPKPLVEREDAVELKPVSGTVPTVALLQSIGSSANAPSQAQLSPTTIQVPMTATVPQAALAATGIGSIEIGAAFPQQTIGAGATFEAETAGTVVNLMAASTPALAPFSLTLASTGVAFTVGVTYTFSLIGSNLAIGGSDGSSSTAVLAAGATTAGVYPDPGSGRPERRGAGCADPRTARLQRLHPQRGEREPAARSDLTNLLRQRDLPDRGLDHDRSAESRESRAVLRVALARSRQAGAGQDAAAVGRSHVVHPADDRSAGTVARRLLRRKRSRFPGSAGSR